MICTCVLRSHNNKTAKVKELGMNKNLVGTIIALALAASATGVSASSHKDGGHGPRGPMPTFEEFDANKDGKVSKDEMQAFAKAQFAKMDANSDGGLSADEMAKDGMEKMKKRQDKMFKKMDENGDGVLSFDELNGKMAKRGEKMFDRLDADGDGLLSKDEMGKMKQGRKGGHGGKDGERHGKGDHAGKGQDNN